jgi:hypothetical protein
MWALASGILIERAIGITADSSQLDAPVLFSLSHPLDELKPVLRHSPGVEICAVVNSGNVELADFISDPHQQVLFVSSEPSLVVTFHDTEQCHTVWQLHVVKDNCKSDDAVTAPNDEDHLIRSEIVLEPVWRDTNHAAARADNIFVVSTSDETGPLLCMQLKSKQKLLLLTLATTEGKLAVAGSFELACLAACPVNATNPTFSTMPSEIVLLSLEGNLDVYKGSHRYKLFC